MSFRQTLGVILGANRRVMVTAGSNMAFLNAMLAIADPGDEILLILDTAEAMREIGYRPIKKVPTLRGKTVVLAWFPKAFTGG